MSLKIIRILLILIAISCYAAAFSMPAMHLVGAANTDGKPSDLIGLAAFFTGFFGLFDGQYAWLANPLAWLALMMLLIRLNTPSVVLSLAALFIAQHTRALVGTTIDGDEAGVKKELVTSLGSGFYLWSASFLILGIAALFHGSKQSLLDALRGDPVA